ncbi:MAG: Acetate kinase, partial [Actinomyces urogenitalis DORA_12]
MTTRTVLVINSGSSSIKYQLVDPDSGDSLASGIVERIGDSIGAITHKHAGQKIELDEPVPDHGYGLAEVLRLFEEHGPSLADAHIVAVGHRVVQGGRYFSGPALIDDEVVAKIEELVPLGPLHNPAHLKGIEVARKLLSDVPHVAVFDTAFFQDLPEEAARYGL